MSAFLGRGSFQQKDAFLLGSATKRNMEAAVAVYFLFA